MDNALHTVMPDLAISRENWWFGWPSGDENLAIAMPTKTSKSSGLQSVLRLLSIVPEYYTRGRCNIDGVINYHSATTLLNSGET